MAAAEQQGLGLWGWRIEGHAKGADRGSAKAGADLSAGSLHAGITQIAAIVSTRPYSLVLHGGQH